MPSWLSMMRCAHLRKQGKYPRGISRASRGHAAIFGETRRRPRAVYGRTIRGASDATWIGEASECLSSIRSNAEQRRFYGRSTRRMWTGHRRRIG